LIGVCVSKLWSPPAAVTPAGQLENANAAAPAQAAKEIRKYLLLHECEKRKAAITRLLTDGYNGKTLEAGYER
jgi:hypothetical protein